MKISSKGKIGIALVVLGMILPVFALIVPFLGLSEGLSAGLVGFLMIGGPEIFIVAGGALAGKEGVLLVKEKAKSLLGLPKGNYTAPRSQYNLALFLLAVWLISLLVPFYIPAVYEWTQSLTIKWYYYAIGDLVFVLVFLFLGGNQLITKIGRLLTWEPWEFPDRGTD